MKSRSESLIRLKKFQVDEKRRQVAQIEMMVADFERMAAELDQQIEIEQQKTGISDVAHFAYSTFAKAAIARRDNLLASAARHARQARGGAGCAGRSGRGPQEGRAARPARARPRDWPPKPRSSRPSTTRSAGCATSAERSRIDGMRRAPMAPFVLRSVGLHRQMRHAAILELFAERDEAELFVERQLVGLRGEVEPRFAAARARGPSQSASCAVAMPWPRAERPTATRPILTCSGRNRMRSAPTTSPSIDRDDVGGGEDRSCRTLLLPARAARARTPRGGGAMAEIAEVRGEGDGEDQRSASVMARHKAQASAAGQKIRARLARDVPVDLRHLQGRHWAVVVAYDGADARGGAVPRARCATRPLPEGPLTLGCRLYGSLAYTGEGHGTIRAVLCGLLGMVPATLRPGRRPTRRSPSSAKPEPYGCRTGGWWLCRPDAVTVEKGKRFPAHPNGMTFVLCRCRRQGVGRRKLLFDRRRLRADGDEMAQGR